MATPTPRPAKLKLLNGVSPGRDSGGRLVKPPPNFARGCPEPPADLGAEALAEWERITSGLDRLNLLKSED
jgi:phage terminase small subunit